MILFYFIVRLASYPPVTTAKLTHSPRLVHYLKALSTAVLCARPWVLAAEKNKEKGPKRRPTDPSGTETQNDQYEIRTRNRYFDSSARSIDTFFITNGESRGIGGVELETQPAGA